MSSISKKAREERMKAFVSADEIISTTRYNATMGIVVAWGILLNMIICYYFQQNNTTIYQYINPIAFLVLYLVMCISGIMIARKSKSAVVSFIGYNLVVVPLGLVISVLVNAYANIDPSIVTVAFLDTLIIAAFMILASILFPSFFAKIGGVLAVCLIGLLVCGIVSMFLGGVGIWYSYIGAAIFSLYIGYDFYRSQQFPKTYDNAVDCALDIYLDIANLFLDLLRILGKNK